jgi:hypothetical protein
MDAESQDVYITYYFTSATSFTLLTGIKELQFVLRLFVCRFFVQYIEQIHYNKKIPLNTGKSRKEGFSTKCRQK